MATKKFSEQQMVLAGNIMVLMAHFLMVLAPDVPDVSIPLTLMAYGIAIPMVIYSYREVRLNNYLVKYGRRITAKIYHEKPKILPTRTAALILVQCTYMENGVIHIFKEYCGAYAYNFTLVLDTLERKDTVDVLVDSTYKKYKIIFDSLYEDLDYEDYKCPAYWNYLLLALNIGCIALYLSM